MPYQPNITHYNGKCTLKYFHIISTSSFHLNEHKHKDWQAYIAPQQKVMSDLKRGIINNATTISALEAMDQC